MDLLVPGVDSRRACWYRASRNLQPSSCHHDPESAIIGGNAACRRACLGRKHIPFPPAGVQACSIDGSPPCVELLQVQSLWKPRSCLSLILCKITLESEERMRNCPIFGTLECRVSAMGCAQGSYANAADLAPTYGLESTAP